MSRNVVLAALLSLAFLPAPGLADEIPLRLDQLRPGQTHIGRANIQNIIDQNSIKTVENNRKLENQSNPKSPLQNYAAKMDGGAVLPVVRAPDGTYVMLDGHHRTTSYWSIFEEAQNQWDQGNHGPKDPRPEMPSIKASVEQDFSKKGWKEFANWMVEHKKVFFGQDILKLARKRRGVPLDKPSDEEFIKKNAEFLCKNYLPKDFKSLIDSPIRSAVGTVLFDLNEAWDKQQAQAGVKKIDRKSLDGSNQVEYIEFLIGDHLKKKGIEAEIERFLKGKNIDPPILKGNEYNPGVLRIIEDAIFDNDAERAYLADSCRRRPVECTEADKTAVSEAVTVLYGIHNTKRATSPGAQPNANPAGQLPPPLPILRQGQPAAPAP